MISLRPVISGILTYIPGLMPAIEKVMPGKGGGSTSSASYCYGVWLKHLTMLWENGMQSMPDTIAELGPGGSLGVGLAAMLSGVNKYYALDVVRHTNLKANLAMLDDLVELMSSGSPRPTKGWPDFDEYLDEKLFPGHILTHELLQQSLSEQRILAIRSALENMGTSFDGIEINYMAPWQDASVIKHESVDLILSHSVLEHVDDIERTYQVLNLWLKKGGLMSHQVDFSCHGLSTKWNGHWSYSDLTWKIIYGKRTFLINRQPASIHLQNLENNSFDILCALKNMRSDGIARTDLAPSWHNLSDDDLGCCGVYFNAVKAG